MTHISALPVELLVYIFKWVISNDLDTISLENVAQVQTSIIIIIVVVVVTTVIIIITHAK